MSEETKPHWYLVQARPRQAALAVEHLERQGYCVFHPRLRVEQLRRGRPVVVEQALFPDGYVCVKCWSPAEGAPKACPRNSSGVRMSENRSRHRRQPR